MNLTEKIISSHLVSGEMIAGQEIAIRIDQTLTQDSTGTMAYLQYESMNAGRVKTKKSVAYIDHNTLQSGFENADDHAYITSVALKNGISVSKAGNGICHQVHLERFGVPGQTLLGSDSHTPTGGGLGMLAIGAGGLDVAAAMGGGAYYLLMPAVTEIRLSGALSPMVSAKDIILEVLRRLSVKGGVGKVMEYTGPGVKTLSVPERATITNMGAELGATASIFPSDGATEKFLKAQGRGAAFSALAADSGARYAETVEIDLSKLVPLAACPHSPDSVVPVSELSGKKADQICIGSCTNSSYEDMMKVAAILKGNAVAPGVSLTVSPGSRQVLNMLAKNGALADIIAAGARILECACGPCIGMGQSPKTDAVSLRTFNRNFYSRSGTASASVFLVSPETAAASALSGVITDPRALGSDRISVGLPEKFEINDNMILEPADFPDIEVERGPNIKPFPSNSPPKGAMSGKALIKTGDNITTDHIMPSDAKLLPFRSNIPHLAKFCLSPVDPEFSARAEKEGGGFIVAGQNYGQGSSREHAALVPVYFKIKAVLAKSFARIHKDNLINNGILPLEFLNASDYDAIKESDILEIPDVPEQIKAGGNIRVENKTAKTSYECKLSVTDRQRNMLLSGGLLNMIKESSR